MTQTTKKTYQKPQITKVKLVPEQAVLEVCKITGVTGPDGSNCQGAFEGDCLDIVS